MGAILAGCAAKSELGGDIQAENRRLESQLHQARETISDQQQTIEKLKERTATLSGLGEQRLELLFRVEKISLGRYTGGTELDDEPGDDGVKVYVIPQDQMGRAVTAAGSVEIDVFDLAVKDDSLLMSYSFPLAQAKQHWQSGALANHYSFTCPWQQRRPSGHELTIRVKFTDYLTGQTFTATKQCRIRLSLSDQ